MASRFRCLPPSPEGGLLCRLDRSVEILVQEVCGGIGDRENVFPRKEHRIAYISPYNVSVFLHAPRAASWGALGRAFLFVACLSHLSVDHASLSRRRAVPTPNRDTSNICALITLLHILHINCSLILSPPFLAFCGGAERDRREGEGWRQRESSTLHRNEALQPLCTDDSSSPSLCMDRRSLSDLFRRMVALSLSCCR